MTLIVNKGKTEVLPGEPCARDRRRLGRPLGLALAPIARPSRVRELVGGRLTLPEIFPVLALIVMVGYLIWCILGEPTWSLSSMDVGEVRHTLMPRVHPVAAFVAVGLFIYLTLALLWPERVS